MYVMYAISVYHVSFLQGREGIPEALSRFSGSNAAAHGIVVHVLREKESREEHEGKSLNMPQQATPGAPICSS